MIRKKRSQIYSTIIEVGVPVRFYWSDGEYDGFEFGPLCGCSKHQIGLLKTVIDQMVYERHCARVVEYMRTHHSGVLVEVLEELDAMEDVTRGETAIPKAIQDAFKED